MKKYSKLSEFEIEPVGELSQLCLQAKLSNFQLLCGWLENLPYGRTTSRTNLSQLFTENRGTCSSKHGLFKTVALENGYDGFKLIIGIYKMNSQNTPGIGNVISNNQLDYIPEAHSYIRYNDTTIDLTNTTSSFDRIESDVLEELEIEPNQIGQFKVDFHQSFLQEWIAKEKIHLAFDVIWKLREQCIANLSTFA